MEYLSWNMLATIAGAVAAVTLLTQVVKQYIKNVDPKWIALAISFAIQAGLFVIQSSETGYRWQNAVLAVFNTLIVVSSAIGTFETGKSCTGGTKGEDGE